MRLSSSMPWLVTHTLAPHASLFQYALVSTHTLAPHASLFQYALVSTLTC